MSGYFDDDAFDDALPAPSFGADDPEEPAPAPGDGGFSDRGSVVRVWVQDSRLVNVRVSPVWFHKADGPERLAACFREALAQAAVEVPDLPEEEPEDEPETGTPGALGLSGEAEAILAQLPPWNATTLAAFREAADDLEGRLDAALGVDPPELVARPATGTSEGVTVHLDEGGKPCAVEFDEDWLDDVQAGDIVTHVLRAEGLARATSAPAEPVKDDVDDLLEERDALRAAWRAWAGLGRETR